MVDPSVAVSRTGLCHIDVHLTLGVDEHIVRHEALLFRMEVRDLRRFAVVAVG